MDCMRLLFLSSIPAVLVRIKYFPAWSIWAIFPATKSALILYVVPSSPIPIGAITGINGDPSKGELSYVNWIELIRFKETRNYVQRVLENINVYKYILSKEPVKIDNFFN